MRSRPRPHPASPGRSPGPPARWRVPGTAGPSSPLPAGSASRYRPAGPAAHASPGAAAAAACPRRTRAGVPARTRARVPAAGAADQRRVAPPGRAAGMAGQCRRALAAPRLRKPSLRATSVTGTPTPVCQADGRRHSARGVVERCSVARSRRLYAVIEGYCEVVEVAPDLPPMGLPRMQVRRIHRSHAAIGHNRGQ